MSQSTNSFRVKRLVESALMIAMAFVLSTFVKVDAVWANGGSVTLAGLLPIIIVSYRYGIKWGVITGFAYSLLELMFGLGGLRGMTPAGLIAAVVLDYLIAFTFVGIGTFVKKFIAKPVIALPIASTIGLVIRFLCHFVSGIVVWGDVVSDGLWAVTAFSFSYNAGYMIPNILITAVVAVILGAALPKYFKPVIVPGKQA